MENEPLSAGFARLDTTAPLGVYINGYYVTRIAKGVLDPTCVRAAAFSQGDRTAVLLVVDALGNYGQTGLDWPDELAAELGLPSGAVMICYTHSHTAGMIDSYREPVDEQYRAWMYRRFRDAARLALDDRREVTDVRAASDDLPGMAHVRRYRMKDGTVNTNPPFKTEEDRAKIVEPACQADTSFRVVTVERRDAPRLVLVSFQAHPDSIGGEKISADYPGALCRRVEQLLPDARCIYLNGCEGQQVRQDRRFPPVTEPPRYERCLAYGEKLGDEAVRLCAKAVSTGRLDLILGRAVVKADAKRAADHAEEARRVVKLFEAGETDAISASGSAVTRTVSEAYYLVRHEDQDIRTIDVPLTAFAVGGAVLLGFPGEPFCEIGVHLRKHTQFACVCACCQANGSLGYFPLAKDYDEGGYEPCNTRVAKGTAELLMAEGDRLLDALR